MATITAVVTDKAREVWPQVLAGMFGTTLYPISTFKVGEGGWQLVGEDAARKLPDQTLEDLDCIENAGTYPEDSRSSFEKSLSALDFTFEAPSTLRVRCLLDFGDFNLDDSGNSPELWELALFGPDPSNPTSSIMVAYATFPKQIKDDTKQLENVVRIIF